jgi:hypothetical protein
MTGRRARLTAGFVLAATLVAGVAACGPAASDTPPPSPEATAIADAGSVCGLVPDMDGLVGRAAIAPAGGYTVGALTRCTWVFAADPSRSVGVVLGPAQAHADTVAAFGAGEAVEGLGDDARWWPANRALSVETGERSFQVELQLDPPQATRELAEAIAAAVLASLG